MNNIWNQSEKEIMEERERSANQEMEDYIFSLMEDLD